MDRIEQYVLIGGTDQKAHFIKPEELPKWESDGSIEAGDILMEVKTAKIVRKAIHIIYEDIPRDSLGK